MHHAANIFAGQFALFGDLFRGEGSHRYNRGSFSPH